MASKPKPLGTRGQPEQTRAAILEAAMREFAAEGLAGARTDSIARAARVNKALLYYYFKDKETLYGAALDEVFAGLTQRLCAVLDRDLPPREKFVEYVGAHFDYVASHPSYPRMVQLEMMRSGRTGSPHLERIVTRYLKPFFGRLVALFQEGIAAGEFRDVNPTQVIPSIIAMIVFYFSTAPFMKHIIPGDPLSPERIAERRVALIDFVSAGVLRDYKAARRQSQRPEVHR